PSQFQHFAPAHTRECEQARYGLQPFWASREDRVEFCRLEITNPASGSVWEFYPERSIGRDKLPAHRQFQHMAQHKELFPGSLYRNVRQSGCEVAFNVTLAN